ncbi:MAG TPA: 4Fe-4S dicluster domain-containing protein [Nitriliruptorales bacterium]
MTPSGRVGPPESAELAISSEVVGHDAWRPGHGAPHPPGRYGFFTDTTVCIGCKACEVACKQWNRLPDDGFASSGASYDNTGDLGATTWRHVAFIEVAPGTSVDGFADLGFFGADAEADGAHGGLGSEQLRWLMMSDVCKHCVSAACLEVCPTGSLVRTEFDTVVVQDDVCNGCGMCVPACPFGVIDRNPHTGGAAKCTLCYDRLQDGLEPACAKACPTDSIVFGEHDDLVRIAEQRVAHLHARGVDGAYLYGHDAEAQPGTAGLNAFFLLTDAPEVYNLPPDPVSPTRRIGGSWLSALASGLAMVAAVAVAVAGASGRDT